MRGGRLGPIARARLDAAAERDGGLSATAREILDDLSRVAWHSWAFLDAHLTADRGLDELDRAIGELVRAGEVICLPCDGDALVIKPERRR